MLKPKLTYFDFPGGRGEDCRMALYIAGVDFEDNRLKGSDWAALKPATPYGGLPVLEVEGKPMLAQSNAILAWVGTSYGLLPKDHWESARHLAVMAAVEELRSMMDPSGRLKDDAEKKRVREELASGPLKAWAANIEKQIGGPFFGGTELQVSDLKIFTAMNWIKKGVLDHIPTTVFDDFPKLNALFDAVLAHPKVAEWRARFSG